MQFSAEGKQEKAPRGVTRGACSGIALGYWTPATVNDPVNTAAKLLPVRLRALIVSELIDELRTYTIF